ncbi:hypothetical protein Y032_0002g731 [Ancylostoma ceylanicum]|uniref:Uncharacterized protein n=1 Tax=Ancylostoma ceylanicum TaxID=53326 RepID=A0A016W2W1_9BILA|nr:hypothetical protein Y032_0002g731 [Ancylostoma ceylanicum]
MHDYPALSLEQIDKSSHSSDNVFIAEIILRLSRDKSRGVTQFKRHDTCASTPEVGGVLARACALGDLAAALRARAAASASPIYLRLLRLQPASMG